MNRTNPIPALLVLVAACCTLLAACNNEPRKGLDDVAIAPVETSDLANASQPTTEPAIERAAEATEDAKAEPTAEATVDAKLPKVEATKEEKPEVVPMTIGSAAPKLDIEHWIQDGGGHFAKLSEFEPDKVYVVEFWATWCGPCIASMPHIAALQQSYADRGVQVVSITREDVATVEKFLDRQLKSQDPDAEPQTYRDLTSVYCLTADPDGSTSRDYMQAANRNGIPCAFIVGKDSKIEWIGHPMGMDEPLEKVVTDTWDRDAFAVEFQAEQKANEVLAQVSSKMRRKETKEAIAILDDYINSGAPESQRAKFRIIKFTVMAGDKEFADETTKLAVAILSDESLDASAVNQLAWSIYQLSESGRLENEDVLRAALDASQKAAESAGPARAYLLDTVAHLHYALGDREAALKTQQSAMEAADAGQKPQLAGFLNQLEKEIKADQEPSEDKASEKPSESGQDENPEQ